MEDVTMLHSGILDLADTRKVTKTTFTELMDQPQIFLYVYIDPPFHIDDLWIWFLRVGSTLL